MRARQEAAEAARAVGRQTATYEVANKPLVRNGERFTPGAKIELAAADAAPLLERGRIRHAAEPRPSKGKAAKEG